MERITEALIEAEELLAIAEKQIKDLGQVIIDKDNQLINARALAEFSHHYPYSYYFPSIQTA